ncbi:hypothetical protein [Pseudanabaena mucicola]|nr:hypothetical protein [Pseudanabaena mucicola]
MLVTRGGGPGAITLNFSDSDRYLAPSPTPTTQPQIKLFGRSL